MLSRHTGDRLQTFTRRRQENSLYVRATNLVGNGTLYLEDSHVRAQGWGALSTDDASRVRMFVKDSLIEDGATAKE